MFFMELAMLKLIQIYDKIQELYLYFLRLYSRKQELLEENILEEIVACERMTHKNLTQKLRVLYQLIYCLLARKKMGVTTFVQKILACKHFKRTMFYPLDCSSRPLYRHIRQCSLHQKAIKHSDIQHTSSFMFYMIIANYRYTQVHNYNKKQA